MSELRMHAMCEIYPHVYVVGVYVYFNITSIHVYMIDIKNDLAQKLSE